MRILRWILALCFALPAGGEALQAQEPGTITGVVIESTTQRPVTGVQIQVVGTQLGATTSQAGRFLVRGVPAGEREVRVVMIGYAQESRTVTVAPGQTVTVDVTLRETAIALEGLIVTASGATQRRREVGNVVGNINVADVELGAVASVAQLLTARSPGVAVQAAGGTTGGSQRIRIRGSNSVSLSNEPLLIIDGVRVNNAAEAMGFGVGGQTISRMNDLNPEEIESIEILKGPAAAAMYGTAAANGVIQITTRQGNAGAARWEVYSETGYVWDPTEYPANYGWKAAGSTSVQCTLYRVSTGACTREGEMLVFSPLEAADPFRNHDNVFGIDRAGTRNKAGARVAGGSDAFSYYVAADRESERGVYPNNGMGRLNLRANSTARVRDDLDLKLTAGWTNNRITLPQNDNNLLGQLGGALLGRPVDDDARRGYAGDHPDRLQQISFTQSVRRFTGGLNANYRPLSWLALVGQAGIDGIFTHDGATMPANTIRSSTLNLLGFRGSNRSEVVNYNLSGGATVSYGIAHGLTGQTSAGVQYQRELLERTDAFGRQLLPGTERLPGTSVQFAVSEIYQDNRTLGGYAQQQLGFRDRIFLTGALRGDDNSAFGSDFGLVVYPSVSGSWVIADEEWFPEQDIVSSLRLRAAFGTSGLRPSFRDAITYFLPVAATVDGRDAPAFTVGGVGDPRLKPERTREYEAGVDVGFLDERVGVEVTYYDKRSRDALVFRRLAPSVGGATGGLGQGVTGRFENIGVVSNRGWEVLVRAQPVATRPLTWDVQGTLSTNRNRLEELGAGVEPIVFGLGGGTQRHTPGYPVGGYWDRRLVGWSDANGDGVIQHTEITLSEAPEFIGSPNPGREFAVTTALTLFDRVRVNVLVDGKADYILNNSTRYFRCVSAFVNCREAFDPTAPVRDQARAIAGVLSRGVYFEDASFAKLREVALTFMAPETLNHRLRLAALSLTLAGRNLHTWTKYSGFDPEVNFAGGSNQTVSDFNTQPPLRYFTARINLSF
jgi:TonB-dependent starch-binding outer membrane protein SusC